jgi:hypothetical protein
MAPCHAFEIKVTCIKKIYKGRGKPAQFQYNASYRLGNTYLRNIKHLTLLGALYTCTVAVAKRTATLESKQCGGVFHVTMYPPHPHRENLACLLFLRDLVGYMPTPPEHYIQTNNK